MKDLDAQLAARMEKTYTKRLRHSCAADTVASLTRSISLWRPWKEWNDDPTHPRWGGTFQHRIKMRDIADRAIIAHDRLKAQRRALQQKTPAG